MRTVLQNRIALILSFVGIFISGVLSIGVRYEGKVPCGVSNGCEQVANHPSSHLLGIPNAYLGLAVYIVLAALSYWRIAAPESARKALIAGYALAAIGTLWSLILTVISFTVIHATCLWCLSSAGTMVALLLVHAFLVQGAGETPEPRGDAILLSGLLLATLIGLGAMGATIADNAATTGLKTVKLENADPLTIFPKDAHVYGNPGAPVTVVEFGDLVCPQCRSEFPKMTQYVGAHAGEVKFVLRHFPLIGHPGHELAAPAAIMSEIAAEKGSFWDFVSLVYSDSEGPKTMDSIIAMAESVGIDTKKALKRIQDENDPAFKRVMKDLKDAGTLGVQGTPTYIILAPGVPPRAALAETLYRDLQGSEYSKFFKNGGQ